MSDKSNHADGTNPAARGELEWVLTGSPNDQNRQLLNHLMVQDEDYFHRYEEQVHLHALKRSRQRRLLFTALSACYLLVASVLVAVAGLAITNEAPTGVAIVAGAGAALVAVIGSVYALVFQRLLARRRVRLKETRAVIEKVRASSFREAH